MALIQCSECNTTISEKAEACPKCGYPLRAEASSASNANIESDVRDTTGGSQTSHFVATISEFEMEHASEMLLNGKSRSTVIEALIQQGASQTEATELVQAMASRLAYHYKKCMLYSIIYGVISVLIFSLNIISGTMLVISAIYFIINLIGWLRNMV